MRWVGGTAKVGARRAARFGLPFQPANNDPEMLGLYVSECERLGVENPMVLPPGSGECVWASEDPDRTWAQIGPHLLHDAMTYSSWQPKGQRTEMRSHATTVEALRAEGKYRVLTPAECLQRAEERGVFCDFTLFVSHPHSLTTASSGSLDHHWKTNVFGNLDRLIGILDDP